MLLGESESVFSSGYGFEEAARKDPAIISILLLGNIIGRVILPASEVERLFFLISVLGVKVTTQMFEDHLVIDCHAIIRLYPLLAKVDSSAGPVCVAVVYGNENDVLFKDIELLRPFGQSSGLVPIFEQLGPEEGTKVPAIQGLARYLGLARIAIDSGGVLLGRF